MDRPLSRGPTGRLIVISGPSGAGKGTLIKEALSSLEGVALSISATTRPRRKGERHGRDYFFLSEPEFRHWAEEGRFLEWAEYAGYLYGTPVVFVEASLAGAKDVILEIELKGAAQVLAKHPEAAVVYIMPPSLEELERRLRSRNTEDEQAIQSRLARAHEEMAEVESRIQHGLPPLHYVIVNNALNRAGKELVDIIRSLREQNEQAHHR